MRPHFVIICIFFFISCAENENEIIQNECDDSLTKVIVYDSGPISLDGCSWLIGIENIWYSPTNLEMKYQIDSNVLFIDYLVLADTFRCSFGVELLKIELLDVCQE